MDSGALGIPIPRPGNRDRSPVNRAEPLEYAAPPADGHFEATVWNSRAAGNPPGPPRWQSLARERNARAAASLALAPEMQGTRARCETHEREFEAAGSIGQPTARKSRPVPTIRSRRHGMPCTCRGIGKLRKGADLHPGRLDLDFRGVDFGLLSTLGSGSRLESVPIQQHFENAGLRPKAGLLKPFEDLGKRDQAACRRLIQNAEQARHRKSPAAGRLSSSLVIQDNEVGAQDLCQLDDLSLSGMKGIEIGRLQRRNFLGVEPGRNLGRPTPKVGRSERVLQLSPYSSGDENPGVQRRQKLDLADQNEVTDRRSVGNDDHRDSSRRSVAMSRLRSASE